jgi:hypothetical protein
MTETRISVSSIAATSVRSLFPLWLAAIGLGVPLALILLAASPLGSDFFYVVAGIPALLFVWVMAGVAALFVSVRSAMRKNWRRCVAALVLPVVLAVVALDPVGFVRSCNTIGDVLHFVVLKPYYDRQISSLPIYQRPRLVVFTGAGCRGLHAD